MTDFATATACRCPPESPATRCRTDFSVVTERLSSASRDARSMLGSSRTTRLRYPLPAQEHVRYDVEVVGEREVLVDDLDAEVRGVPRAVDIDMAALESDLALVEGVDPDDALDQGRLSGPVVADESHDLTAADLEVDLVERLNRAERLRDAPRLEERRRSAFRRLARRERGGGGALRAPPLLPRRPRPTPSTARSGVLLAEVRLCHVSCADLLDRPEVVRDDGVDDVVDGDRDGLESDEGNRPFLVGRLGGLARLGVDPDDRRAGAARGELRLRSPSRPLGSPRPRRARARPRPRLPPRPGTACRRSSSGSRGRRSASRRRSRPDRSPGWGRRPLPRGR